MGRDEGVHARTAAKVEHALAGSEGGEIEEVAYSGKRLDGAGWHRSQQRGGIAQPLGQRSSHLEVIATPRLLGHLPVHHLDLVIKLVNVDAAHLNSSRVLTAKTSARRGALRSPGSAIIGFSSSSYLVWH
jgi:hypothetical protein